MSGDINLYVVIWFTYKDTKIFNRTFSVIIIYDS